MNELKTRRIIEEMLKPNEKIRKAMVFMKEAKDIIDVPKIDLSDILMKLNQDEILIEQEIEISGFLSNVAYFDIPCTYQTSTINGVQIMGQWKRIKDENGKEKQTRDYSVEVKPLYPPLFYNTFSENKEMLCFLYQDANCMNVDIVCAQDEYSIKMRDRNKYIPVLIDQKIFQKYRNKHIKAIACVNVMSKDVAEMFSRNAYPEYKKLIDFFYDPSYMDFKGIYLTLHDVEMESSNCINKIYHNYGLEFFFSNASITQSLINERIMKVMKNYVSTEKVHSIYLNGDRLVYFVKEKFSVHYFNNNLGFYMQFNEDIGKQRAERKYFFDKVNQIIGDIHLKCEVSFISNEKDMEFFKQNKGIEYA